MTSLAFVQKQPFPYFGVLSLIAYCRSFYPDLSCRVIIYRDDNDLLARLHAARPDAVAFSALTTEHRWLCHTLPLVQQKLGVPVILGGFHATIYSRECFRDMPELAYLCVGDGEECLRQFIAAVMGGAWDAVPGLVRREAGTLIRNPPAPLFTDFARAREERGAYYQDYPYLAAEEMKQFLSSRGCPFKCFYCLNADYHAAVQRAGGTGGQGLRRKTVELFVEEISRVQRQHPLTTVYIADDNFITDEAWLTEFHDRYRREIGLPFVALTSGEMVNANKARLLKSAGCRHVVIGLEIADEKIRREYLGRPGTNQGIARAIDLLRAAGLQVVTTNMHLAPGATTANFIANVEFNVQHGVAHPKSSLYLPFPGTRAERICLDGGWLPRPLQLAELPQSFYFTSVLDLPEKARLLRLHKLFYFMVKFPRWRQLLLWLSRLPLPVVYDIAFLTGAVLGYREERGLSVGATLKWFWSFRHSR